MVTRDELLDLDFYSLNNNPIEYFYDSWEYMFLFNTQELFCINDGFGEPQFIAKIDNLAHLKEVLDHLYKI